MQYSKNLANTPPSSGGSGTSTLPNPLTISDLVVTSTFLNQGTTALVGSVFANVDVLADISANNILASNVLSVGNNIIGAADLQLSGTANIGNALDVTGDSTLRGDLSVGGTSYVRVLNVSGNTTFAGGNITILRGTTTVSSAGTTTIRSPVTISGFLNKTGSNWFSNGNTIFFDTVKIEKDLNVPNLSGSTNVSGALTVRGVNVLTTPLVSILGASGTIALSLSEQYNLYIFTSGTDINFTTGGIPSTSNGTWYLKNSISGTTDITVRHASALISPVNTLHGRTTNNNSAIQVLLWRGGDLYLY